jgi:hypothetical protein
MIYDVKLLFEKFFLAYLTRIRHTLTSFIIGYDKFALEIPTHPQPCFIRDEFELTEPKQKISIP